MAALCSCGTDPIHTGEMPGTEKTLTGDYKNVDYSTKLYRSKQRGRYFDVLYNDRLYYTDAAGFLKSVDLSDFTNDVQNGRMEYCPEEKMELVCPDPLCPCKRSTLSQECNAYLFSLDAQYVLDAHESGGGYPVFYYTETELITPADWDGEEDLDYETLPVAAKLFRYDPGSNKKAEILRLDETISSFAVYDDLLFLSHYDVNGKYSVTAAKKSGKILYTTGKVDNTVSVFGYEDGKVYYADADGRIYRADSANNNGEEIYRTNAFILTGSFDELRFFIYDGYMYFDSDFKSVDHEIKGGFSKPITVKISVRTIGRLPLNDPKAPVETVAENVYLLAMLGVFDGSLYYCKYEPRDDYASTGYSQNFTSGNIYKTDLVSLKTEVFRKDVGLRIDFFPSYFSEDFMICVAEKYDDRFGPRSGSEGFITCLYDFKTGKWIGLDYQ